MCWLRSAVTSRRGTCSPGRCHRTNCPAGWPFTGRRRRRCRRDRSPVTGFEVTCVGESMALVTPDPPAPLAEGGPMRLDVAGAESTVACYLAMLGVRVAWASRVGDDPLGRLVRSRIAVHGVDTSLVTVDPDAPTGVFF